MELNNKRILIAAQYAPSYGGNFIPSLRELTLNLMENGANVEFAFPQKAAEYEWAWRIQREYTVYFTGNDSSLVTNYDLEQMPAFDLIYTHFEGYDTAFMGYMPPSTHYVWHMHDTLSFQTNPLKKVYQCYAFWRHYGKPFIRHDINLIAVNRHETDFVRPYRCYKRVNESVIPNGIDLLRIKPHTRKVVAPYTFLAYGGRNVQKRIDLILKAGEMLSNVNGGGVCSVNHKRNRYRGSCT